MTILDFEFSSNLPNFNLKCISVLLPGETYIFIILFSNAFGISSWSVGIAKAFEVSISTPFDDCRIAVIATGFVDVGFLNWKH